MRIPLFAAPASPFVIGALALAALVLPGCDSYTVAEPRDDATGWGDYAIRRANAQALPATIRRGAANRTELIDGTLRLGPGGECRLSMRLRVTVLGVTSTFDESERCRWTQTVDDLQIRWDGGSASTARYESPVRLTLHTGGDTFVLTR
jgi:hypothetical protein